MLTSHYNEYIQLHGMIVTRVEREDEFEEQEKVYIAFEKLYCDVATHAEDLWQSATNHINHRQKSAQGMEEKELSQSKETMLLEGQGVEKHRKQTEEQQEEQYEQTQDLGQDKKELCEVAKTEILQGHEEKQNAEMQQQHQKPATYIEQQQLSQPEKVEQGVEQNQKQNEEKQEQPQQLVQDQDNAKNQKHQEMEPQHQETNLESKSTTNSDETVLLKRYIAML
ncbi:hypothetical protein ZHAS_00010943 [Anopheles sinensis]|uniref:Uncharacterized protein n=1 Tax=Anopheles sinensis TaxID=74873 RepID=A0A084VYX6_ANOSI|nr:hypothetical protein ZHAS_00010943 [Anopheles sinensis]